MSRQAQSRRDRRTTALILGFFGFVWFGWGQANASPGLRVPLAVVALAALAAELATMVPASTVTGLGAGVLLTLFAAVALAGTASAA